MNIADIDAILNQHNHKPERLVQMLWDVQNTYSYIPAAAIDQLAHSLAIPRAQVQGTAEFYSFFYNSPRGQFNILFSNNITDLMSGKQALMDHFMHKLGVELGVPRADGKVTVDNTSCTGMCEQGPALLVNCYAIPRLNKEKLDHIADLVNAGTPLEHWPPEWFQIHSHIRRKDLLLNHSDSHGAELYSLKALLARGADEILAEVEAAGLRGNGGAGFPTAVKWRACRDAESDERFVVCNADEGEPGTFKDRILLQDYPDVVFEGMTLCAGVIGAKKGFLYLRGEYRYLRDKLESVLQARRDKGLLGDTILGQPGFDFDIEIHLGAGAYVCGAESALMESLEGKRGTPRDRLPFPVIRGYKGKPTVVNNVETFAAAAKIPYYGAHKYAAIGTEKSKGTKLVSVSGDCKTPGIYEVPFGMTIRDLLMLCGGEDAQAVQISGAAGFFLTAEEFARQLSFEDAACGGSFMVFDKTRDLLDMVRNFADFFVHESCGFCTPCRVGTSVQKHLIDKIANGHGSQCDLDEIEKLGHLMRQTSHCGLGLTASNHLLDTMQKAPHIYHTHFKGGECFAPSFDLDSALEDARRLTRRNDDMAHL
jgi:[NiFe] hydrogenase diaphorase moiety large subunit